VNRPRVGCKTERPSPVVWTSYRYVRTCAPPTREVLALSRRFLAFALSLLVPIALFEVALRVLGIGQAIAYQPDPMCGYRPAPAQHFSTMGHPVTILASGFRGPVERSDTLFVGDSVTYGTAAVRDEETFPALLGGMNAGANGWGPQNVDGLLHEIDLAPYRRVVWVLPSADVLRPFGYMKDDVVFAAGFLGSSRPMRWRVQYLLRFVWDGYFDPRKNAYSSPENFAKNVDAVADAYALLHARGIDLLFVFLPYREEALGQTLAETPFVERMRDELRERGVPFVEARPPAATARALYRDTTHLNAAGDHWIAGELRPLLERLAER